MQDSLTLAFISMKKEILIKDYWYELPPERIALYPLPERDQSRLLIYKEGKIEHSKFTQLTSFLPPNSTLFFNNTRVIPARLYFQKDTGATIELFLLNPVWPSALVQLAMEAKQSNRWVCTIGNLKRWPEGTTLTKSINNLSVSAKLIDREAGIVEFNWTPPEFSFAEIISQTGFTPLPPYLKRQAEESDRLRYQTVYSNHEGAVAAPTAGLHFTTKILEELKNQGHKVEFLTLHVSAGTFQPVKAENAIDHPMHCEQVIVTIQNIKKLLAANSVIAVGTTSMRTLESIYWYGVKLLANQTQRFEITQFDPYELPGDVPVSKALETIQQKMESENLDSITGETSIMIMPGYNFKIADALITNFHQPGSTLMLLVAAFAGADWKKIYDEALQNDYRFLSYGDSSLLFPKTDTRKI
jgi:S-adenosylmethionine:tRNA ribosyltransferase-isomerase